MAGFAFLIAVIAAVLAVVFWFQWQSAASAVAALRAHADEAVKQAEGARADQRRAIEELKVRSTQLADTREKLVESRRKSHDGKGAQKQPRGVREAELEEDLSNARKLTDHVHAAEQQARRDLAAAKTAETSARAELASAQARVRDLAAQPRPLAVSTPAAAPLPPDFERQRVEIEVKRKEIEAQRAEVEQRAAEAEKAVREAKRKEQEASESVRRAKGRADTNHRVFSVAKGELELTKEKLAQAERRLWQAGIPTPPPASKERPKATGPASADRPRAEPAATGPVAAPALDAPTAAPGEPIAAGQPSVTAEPAQQSAPLPTGAAETTQAVVPVRRRPDGSGAGKPEQH